jgi:hypothetical protein
VDTSPSPSWSNCDVVLIGRRLHTMAESQIATGAMGVDKKAPLGPLFRLPAGNVSRIGDYDGFSLDLLRLLFKILASGGVARPYLATLDMRLNGRCWLSHAILGRRGAKTRRIGCGRFGSATLLRINFSGFHIRRSKFVSPHLQLGMPVLKLLLLPLPPVCLVMCCSGSLAHSSNKQTDRKRSK